MSLSGITVPETVIKRYENKRFERKEGGIVLKIDGDQIVIEDEYSENFSSLVNNLPDQEPRFVLYDVPIKNRANLDDVRTTFIFWMPMESSVKLRMHYAASKSIITKAFRGIATQTQEEEKSSLSLEKLQQRIKRSQGINNI